MSSSIQSNPFVMQPQKGKYYYYTAYDNVSDLSMTNSKFAYAGKYIREAKLYGLSLGVFQNYGDTNQELMIDLSKTAFYEVNPDQAYIQLQPATKLEVVCDAQEGRHYYATNFTEIVDKGNNCALYYTINPLTKYVGKFTGVRMDGWGKNMKARSYFVNEGKEIIIEHNTTTAFYHTVLPSYNVASAPPSYQMACQLPTAGAPPSYDASMCEMPINVCKACKQLGHRIHTCPNEKERQRLYDQSKPKELFVVRTPIVGKYYEATFWEKREGPFDNERHFIKETTKREYVGKYLRHRQEGCGDGADYWGIFLRDGNEIQIEYDYDGKRAFYEVPERT